MRRLSGPHAVLATRPSKDFLLCADKLVQISRIAELWQQRADLQARRMTLDDGAADIADRWNAWCSRWIER